MIAFSQCKQIITRHLTQQSCKECLGPSLVIPSLLLIACSAKLFNSFHAMDPKRARRRCSKTKTNQVSKHWTLLDPSLTSSISKSCLVSRLVPICLHQVNVLDRRDPIVLLVSSLGSARANSRECANSDTRP